MSAQSNPVGGMDAGMWKQALRCMPTPIYLVDANTQQLLMNDAMEELVGVARDEAAEMELWELMRTDETHDTKTTFLDVAIENEEPIEETEARILTHDDEMRDVVVSLAPLYDDTGDLIGGIAGFEDVTDLRETERTLNERQERVAGELGSLAAKQEEQTREIADNAAHIRKRSTDQTERLQDATDELHAFSAQMQEVAAKTDEIATAAE
jgi:PAS domain S-box-containing protein